jgi:hypothetical protein
LYPSSSIPVQATLAFPFFNNIEIVGIVPDPIVISLLSAWTRHDLKEFMKVLDIVEREGFSATQLLGALVESVEVEALEKARMCWVWLNAGRDLLMGEIRVLALIVG